MIINGGPAGGRQENVLHNAAVCMQAALYSPLHVDQPGTLKSADRGGGTRATSKEKRRTVYC